MLFKILKMFGLDVPAKIEAMKASIESRVEEATDHVRQVAQEAAVIAAFSTVAIIAATAAVGVGLLAVYRLTAEFYGPYAGLTAVSAILVVVAGISAAAAAGKSKSMEGNRLRLFDAVPAVGAAANADRIASTVDPTNSEPHVPPTEEAMTPPRTSASDLVEPLAFMLSKYVKYPSVGNPLVDELIGNLRTNAQGTASEAVERAAAVVRHGDRKNLVVVLGGAAIVGWFLSHHFSSHRP
jgi:hypothetical protein